MSFEKKKMKVWKSSLLQKWVSHFPGHRFLYCKNFWEGLSSIFCPSFCLLPFFCQEDAQMPASKALSFTPVLCHACLCCPFGRMLPWAGWCCFFHSHGGNHWGDKMVLPSLQSSLGGAMIVPQEIESMPLTSTMWHTSSSRLLNTLPSLTMSSMKNYSKLPLLAMMK